MKTQRLKAMIPNWKTNGIFTYLNSINGIPWSGIDANTLNFDYHGGYSGDKRASPLLNSMLSVGSETLSDSDVSTLANMAYSLFHVTWSKMWEQLTIEYNPIHNYAMTETETANGTSSGSDAHSGTDTHTINGSDIHSGTDTRTLNMNETHSGSDITEDTGTQGLQGTSKTEGTNTTTSTDSVYGFNSSAWNNDRKNVTESVPNTTETTNNTTTNNLTSSLKHGENVENKGTDAFQHGEQIDRTETDALQHGETVTKSGTHSDTRTLTRSGNIGVTTTAQMLEAERELWKWNFFRNVVYRDLDSLLTIQTY